MLERFNPWLRLVCLVLAGLILFQLSQIWLRRETLAKNQWMAPIHQERSTNSVQTTNSPNAGRAAVLPADVQAAIEKIKQSQILGPDIKPPPMALLGIAGPDVFLRAPNGQTGIIRQGEELGGVKLIQVGVNRVLVEQDKQQKELTIFNGFGSETLMPQQKDKSELSH